MLTAIVFQHITVYLIRRRSLRDILRILKSDGRFSFQMGCCTDLSESMRWQQRVFFKNSFSALSTNDEHDERATSAVDLEGDLYKLEFTEIRSQVRVIFSDPRYPSWIFVH